MDTSGYTRWFRDSTPYISMHRNKTFVVLLEGEALDHPNFVNIVHDLALVHVLGARLVIVHGARSQIANRLPDGVFHNGRRVTREEDLSILLRIFGELRTRVEALFSTGLPTSPLRETEISVVSGNFVTARPLGIIDGVDHQLTGCTRKVHATRIHGALGSGALVLMSPMGYSSSGQVFNLASDELAADVALAIGADKLIVFNDSGALTDGDGDRISQMSPSQLQSIAEANGDPQQSQYLQSMVRACRGGLKSCQLVSYSEDGALLRELFTAQGAGTQIRETGSEFIRPATTADVASIVEMIRPLEESGVLVRRSRDRLEAEIEHFLVAAIDNTVIGCCALYPYGDAVELACVAVHPSYRDADPSVGLSLLEAAEKTARTMGAGRLFVLTTQTRDWFLDNAFVDAPIEDLPAPKQALYNFQRNSKVMIKQLGTKA
ncbi:MAG: amino-acid N-acetyltransferase [Pseudomonadales bacterium]|nr:amino-acid N-acetyltransferase [Pseudomonadales bacterium]